MILTLYINFCDSQMCNLNIKITQYGIYKTYCC